MPFVGRLSAEVLVFPATPHFKELSRQTAGCHDEMRIHIGPGNDGSCPQVDIIHSSCKCGGQPFTVTYLARYINFSVSYFSSPRYLVISIEVHKVHIPYVSGHMSYTPQSHAAPGYYSLAPPPPPPKQTTPSSQGPPLPPPPGQQNGPLELDGGQTHDGEQHSPTQPSAPAIENNWLPENVKDKSYGLPHVLIKHDL